MKQPQDEIREPFHDWETSEIESMAGMWALLFAALLAAIGVTLWAVS